MESRIRLLINQNLMDCADNRRKIQMSWAVMKKRKNNVFFRFFYCYYISINIVYLQNYKKQEGEDVIIAAANQKDGVGKTKTFRREISFTGLRSRKL